MNHVPTIGEAVEQMIEARIKPLETRLRIYESLYPQTVEHAAAARIIGKSGKTLERERDRKDTPIRYTYKGDKPMYFLTSLIDYLDKKEGVTPEGIIQILKAA